jgi:hypothetical protein
MKTRQEMIGEFMVALAGNSNVFDILDMTIENYHEKKFISSVYRLADRLADQFLKGVV